MLGDMLWGQNNQRPLTSEEIREELRRFNDQRKDMFGRAPTPEKPLPLDPTGRGGDVWPGGQSA